MSIVTYMQFCEMLDRAHREGYAYPSINVSTMDTANAAIEGFAAARSDGIVQVSIGAGAHVSGNLGDSVLGAISLAEHVHRVAARYDVRIALTTDHCVTEHIEDFLKPLIAETARRRKAGLPNLFSGHMYDGSDLPLAENMAHAVPLLTLCRDNDLVLEVETGVVGGEEDGLNREGVDREKLYTTPEDMLTVYEALSRVGGGRFMLAATFGNVHGVYKPGNVVLKPEILKRGQEAVVKAYGAAAWLWLVFHGGSGSDLREIHETLQYGVVKMNVDTDTQYAFTRSVADFMLKHYDEVLKVDGEVGVKKSYDPRGWLKLARKGMAARVVRVCEDLKSAGKTLGG